MDGKSCHTLPPPYNTHHHLGFKAKIGLGGHFPIFFLTRGNFQCQIYFCKATPIALIISEFQFHDCVINLYFNSWKIDLNGSNIYLHFEASYVLFYFCRL